MARGMKTGGRAQGMRNKATIERDEKARLEFERLRRIEEERAAGAAEEIAQAAASGVKLMKEIAFDFARLFAGLAAFHQPYPTWHQAVDPETGKPTVDKFGRPVLVNDNPNFDETKFLKYAVLAKDTALGAAPYQSPRFSAVMVGATTVTKIEVTGGLPDQEDGGLVDGKRGCPEAY